MTQFSDSMTLGEAKALLRTLVHKGHHCPCCTQMAKVYKRKLTHAACAAMILLYRRHGRGVGHIPTLAKSLRGIAHQGGYLTLGRYWNLIEESDAQRSDGGRAGHWRLTEIGVAFVQGQTRVPLYAMIYDGRVTKLKGEMVSIKECLGEKFNYNELMGQT